MSLLSRCTQKSVNAARIRQVDPEHLRHEGLQSGLAADGLAHYPRIGPESLPDDVRIVQDVVALAIVPDDLAHEELGREASGGVRAREPVAALLIHQSRLFLPPFVERS